MSQNRPDSEELRRGTTVRVVQEADNNPGEPLIGDVRQIIEEGPQGVLVKLESGVTGRVIEVVTPEREEELTE